MDEIGLLQIILEEQRDFRSEVNDRFKDLEAYQNEDRGVKKAIKFVLSTGLISGIISWFTNNFHH